MFNWKKLHIFRKVINKNDIIEMTIYWRKRCKTSYIWINQF